MMKKCSILVTLSVLALGVEQKDLSEIKVTSTHYSLDELNRNIYIIDSKMIEQKGYNSVGQVLGSMPFVSFSNFGLGQNVDLRGQGASANVNTQVLLNGIGLNMLDSSHGVTPINSVGVDEIESIEVLPGGGAVMYGNGTRGGVVNITTKKRYDKLTMSAGMGYSYANGSNAKANAKIGGKISDGVYAGVGANYSVSQGYRKKDSGKSGNVNGNLTWDINNQHSLSFDAGYFRSDEMSTPVLRFGDALYDTDKGGRNPNKSDRDKAGNGEVSTQQERINVALSYDYRINDSHKLNLKTFFQRYDLGYDKNDQFLNFAFFGITLDNTRANQDGSGFLDTKAGFQARYDFKHTGGLLIVGFDSIYNQGERKLNFDIDWKGDKTIQLPPRPPHFQGGPFRTTSYKHLMNSYVDAKKWSNSLYALEKYDFTQSFSLTGGARYEFAWYGGHREFKNNMQINNIPFSAYSTRKDISHLSHNYALELTPRYDFGLGDVYVKYERGFRSPNPDNLTLKQGRSYIDTNVKSETYDTFELGSKIFAGDHAMFMLTGFYTLTHNEIYTLGTPHDPSNLSKVGNYKMTGRGGVELASEQSFLDGILEFGESFSYVDARILNSGIANPTKYNEKNNSLIPYVSNLKATINASYRFAKGWNLWIASNFIGEQVDTVGNKIPWYNLTDIGVDFSYKGFSFTCGIRNVADTFYYSYYNKDRSDEISGYSFLIGEGRSYFIEGRYKF